MKKVIVALAAVAITAGFAAKADVCKQACDNNNQCNASCANQQCATPGCKAICPFDNLNLTDAQKEQIKALRTKKAEACQAQKQQKKASRSECRRTELAEIKAILTPEQYVQFLENNYVDKGQNRAARHPGMNQGAPRRDLSGSKASKRADAPVKATKLVEASKVADKQ